MSRHRKVEIQKGEVHPGEKTSKMMTHPEKLREASEQASMRRSAQTLHLHEPKHGKK